MTTNELLIEFIKHSNKLEPKRNQIPISRANIFLANHRPEFKNLDLPRVIKTFYCECDKPNIHYNIDSSPYCYNCGLNPKQ